MVFKRAKYEEKTAYPNEYITVVSAAGVEQRQYLRVAISNINDIKMRIKEADKAYAHGSYAYGDGKIESRKMKLSCHIRGENQADHDRQYNDIINLFAQRNYSLRMARDDREYRIAGLVETKQKWVKGFKWLWSDIDITLMMTDPFVYATADTVVNILFTGNQTDKVVSLYNDSAIDVPLIFDFIPMADTPMDNVKIVHTDSGEQMQLTDALLSYPHKVRIDGNVGTVRRDNDNSINTFSGVFLHALAGRNEFKFTGSAGRISIIYRSRWFI